LSAFNSFLRSLNALTDDEVAKIDDCYNVARNATSVAEIKNALNIAATIIIGKQPNPILFSRSKDLHELPYDILDAQRGLHVVRSVFANEVHLLRARRIEKKSVMLQTYLDDGVVLLTDFLGLNNTDLIQEMEQIDISANKQSFNLISQLDKHSLARNVMFNSRLRDCVFECLMLPSNHSDASEQYTNNTFIQRVHNKVNDGDVQKIMHFDTYYDALKFWYFPKEVRIENGPFTISPKSHIMNEARLTWMQSAYMRFYNETIEPERTYGHAEGSLRIFPNEMEVMNLSASPMIVPKDTLIISNVFGFHGRGEATVESIRDSIHGSVRLNSPFDE
jgi:hypothetical protein